MNNEKRIVAITSCPTGIAHTFMSAEALVVAAEALGYHIKVETQGSVGAQNELTAEEIAAADAVVIAADTIINLDRFHGKKLLQTSVKAPLEDGQSVLQQALEADVYQADNSSSSTSSQSSQSNQSSRSSRSNLYRYLMNGVSHMIPFVVTGGLMIALSLALGGEPTPSGMQIPEGSLWNQVMSVWSPLP